ncbi:hypothetical protein DFP73DRAFT_617573 [Morchella snyderi]|nr:hypothetical protein DFP73DRAFT_617573 [Morchella snyderi]
MLDGQSRVLEEDAVNETKTKVYDRIVEYLEAEGYPTVGVEKDIISVDRETGGTEEFVVMDLISVTEDGFVFVIKAKRGSLGEAKKQCLLSMKDMRDRNGGGELYGFVTTGYSWRMIRYDGSFQMRDKFDILFGGIGKVKETWMKDYSVLVDCMNYEETVRLDRCNKFVIAFGVGTNLLRIAGAVFKILGYGAKQNAEVKANVKTTVEAVVRRCCEASWM